MSSITGTVKPPVANTTLTAKQTQLLNTAGSFAGAKAGHNKPLPRELPGKVVDRFLPKVAAAPSRATQARQLHEIAGGVRNGKINATEAEALLKSQQEVATATQRALADGKVTLKESIELSAMQRNAQKLIDTAVKSGGGVFASVAAHLNKNTQAQASQLDKLADGIAKGTITRAETGKLLGQQVQIADARGDADSTKESAALSAQLAKAGKDIERHSKPGTQLDLGRVIGKVIAAPHIAGGTVKG